MTEPRPLDRAALDTVFESVLDQNPTGLIVAIAESGLFMPMPAGVPCASRRVVQGHNSGLELVVPGEARLVIDTWLRARQTGAAQATVHLLAAPAEPVALHYIDARHRFGCYIGLFAGVADHVRPNPEQSVIRPHFTSMRKDGTAIMLAIDDAAPRILGWTADDLVGKRSIEFLHPEDHQRAIANWMDMLAAPGEARRVQLRHRCKGGGWLWVEITNHNVLGDPRDPHVRSEIIDISDEMAAHEAVRASEQILRRLAEALPLGVMQIDRARRPVYRNERMCQILGRRTGGTVEEQLSNIAVEDGPAVEAALARALEDGVDADLELVIKHRQDTRRCDLRIRALTGSEREVTGAILCLADITEDARVRDELHNRATFDSLTRCYNRSSTIAALQKQLAFERQHAPPRGIGLLFIDLDHFKQINDRLGHGQGDRLLVGVAKRLLDAVRVGDLVGRIGGDEFLILFPNVASADNALAIADRIATLVAQPLDLGPCAVTPSASIGVAWSNDPTIEADTLIARADGAMYRSKQERLGKAVLDATTQAAEAGGIDEQEGLRTSSRP